MAENVTNLKINDADTGTAVVDAGVAGEVGVGGKKAAESGLSPKMAAKLERRHVDKGLNPTLSIAELNGLTGQQANSRAPLTDQELGKMTDTTAIIISEFRISAEQIDALKARGFTFEPREGKDCDGWALFYVRGPKAPAGKIQFHISESEPAPSFTARIGGALRKVFGRAR